MKTPGQVIKEARTRAGLSLAKVATPMGISIPFLHDVEHDRRRLAAKRWRDLSRAISGLDLSALAESTVSSGTVEIDATMLTQKQRSALADALLLAVAL